MIAYGVCVGSPDKFERFASRGIRSFGEKMAPIAEVTDAESIFSAYNEILDEFAKYPEMSGLALLHDDLEIRDEKFCSKVAEIFEDPDVAVIGVVGAQGVGGLAWWDGRRFGRCMDTRGLYDEGGGFHEVDAVDGLIMILSPWAIQNLRFDDKNFQGFHGYDVDFCFEARKAGKKVVVAEIRVFHHTKGGFGQKSGFEDADRIFRSKWGLV